MPPKQKKGKGGKGGKGGANKVATPVDGVDTTILTRAKLEEFCFKVHEELTKEKQQSDFLRLERDKLVNMVAIAQEQLVIAKHENYDVQMQLDDAEETRRIEMKSRKGKLTNIRREKNDDCLNTKLVAIKLGELDKLTHEMRLKEVETDINELKSEFINVEQSFSEIKTKQEIENAERTHKLREEEIEKYNLKELKWDKKINNNLNMLDETFKQEYERLKNRKVRESTQLKINNDKFIFDLNYYYKNIVDHNLKLIVSLKSSLREMKTEIAAIDKTLSQQRKKNKTLRKSLEDSNDERQALQEKLKHTGRDKKELNKIREELKRTNETLEYRRIEMHTLGLAANKQAHVAEDIAEETAESLSMLKTALEEIVIVMEYMASHLRHNLEELDSMLSKIPSSSKVRLPQASFDPAKDCLTWDLATVADHHDRILQDYYRLLDKYGIHRDSTGFTPLLSEEILKKANYLRILVKEEVL